MHKKILIIDDDPIIVKYLKAVFSDNGYETCHASNASEGLDAARWEKPDLITQISRCPVNGAHGSTASFVKTTHCARPP